MKNKTKIFSLSMLFGCLTILSGNAQENQESNSPRIGIKGGVNFSNLYGNDADNTKMRTGFNVGVFCKVPVTKRIAVQPEFYYTTKGAQITYNNNFVDGTARFNVNYLELPLLLVVNITDHFNLHAGPYAALLISGRVSNESNVNLFNFEDNINSNDYNKLDAGFAAGVGLDLGAVSLGARYNYGLTRVGKERNYMGTSYTFPDAVNGVLNFYLGISLN